MASAQFVFYLASLFLVKTERRFLSHQTGEDVTLQCLYKGETTWFYWYKQTLGQQPRLMCSFYKYQKTGTFYNEFNNTCFQLERENSTNHLKIKDLQTSDSATYYCAHGSLSNLEFEEGIIVSVKGSGLNVPALVHQSGSETIQPGGSMTLSCTVHTGTCDGQHSVYWFRNSEESHPGLIYTHGDRSDQCERKPDTQTHTCVYNLPMMGRSHVETDYCAVVSCGYILFGNGTKLETKESHVLVYFLSSALAFTTIMTVSLAFLVCTISKRNGRQCAETRARFSASSTVNAESCKNEENLHYAALRVKKADRSRRERDDTEDGCVYASVKQ